MKVRPTEHALLRGALLGYDTYEVYWADSEEDAREFLNSVGVQEPQYYVVVETPQGAIARDRESIYRPSANWRGEGWSSQKYDDLPPEGQQHFWSHAPRLQQEVRPPVNAVRVEVTKPETASELLKDLGTPIPSRAQKLQDTGKLEGRDAAEFLTRLSNASYSQYRQQEHQKILAWLHGEIRAALKRQESLDALKTRFQQMMEEGEPVGAQKIVRFGNVKAWLDKSDEARLLAEFDAAVQRANNPGCAAAALLCVCGGSLLFLLAR